MIVKNDLDTMNKDRELYKRKYELEKEARIKAEKLLEEKSKYFYRNNKSLISSDNEKVIQHNFQQQKIVSKISLSFNSFEKFHQKMNEALQIIGMHSNVSRVYVFEDSMDGLTTSNTYEWCNEGISSQLKQLQNISYSSIPSWKRLLAKKEMIYSENIRELPDDLYTILKPQGIHSIIVFPLKSANKMYGFIGFDECSGNRKWSISEIEFIRTISNIISNAFIRQKIQVNLINSERENRILINSIPDSILQVDNTGKIKSFNSPQKTKLFAKVKNDNTDTIHSVFDEKLSKLFMNAIRRCFIRDHFHMDFKYLREQKIEQYEARFVKLNATEVLVIIRDVTNLKENEKELRIAKNKAEEASRSKSEFLANVSHEIRTPLNAILGFSQWLSDNTNQKQHREYINTILTSGRNLLNLMNDILDLSKIESGQMDIEMQPMYYHEVINDIKLVFQQKVEEKGISFNISTDSSVPSYIYMDELRFYQVLFNLVSNAVKFTEKGYINVSAKATQKESEDKINLIVTVEDTGIGIKKEQQKVIFESFTQQSGQSTRDFEGTGLGLAIVSGLLQKLNGSINLKSEPGKGSVFTLTFFNVKVDTTEHPHHEASQGGKLIRLEPCTIMIVDDIDYNILVLKNLIGTNEVKFIEAKDGTEAMAKLKDYTPDLIFMDIRMPGLSGFDVTEIIRNDKKHAGTPIVAFTASTMNDQNEKINQTFDAYLQKPIFKKDVETVLKKFLPYTHINIDEAQTKDTPHEINTNFSSELIEDLPQVLDQLKHLFRKKWDQIKDNLVIYEIETFKNELEEMAFQHSCSPVLQYCAELDTGLKSFDIELIEKKLSEFPSLIEKLESHQK